MRLYYAEYLASEKLLYLSAGLVGVGSMLLGAYFFIFQPHLKTFALSMLILGAVEAGILLTNYANADRRQREKLSIYEENHQTIASQKIRTQKILNAFFLLKLFYTAIFVSSVLALSKANLGPTTTGILLALLIHAGIAATVDSFGEQFTKKYLHNLSAYD